MLRYSYWKIKQLYSTDYSMVWLNSESTEYALSAIRLSIMISDNSDPKISFEKKAKAMFPVVKVVSSFLTGNQDLAQTIDACSAIFEYLPNHIR